MPTDPSTPISFLIQMIHLLMQISGSLLWALTALVTMLINPGWYNGELLDMSGYFKQIWVLVSNVVYLIFAFALIWIAFANIIGKKDDVYEMKRALPRFAVGILMVPFSWFFVQFTLSITAILTVGMLSLPFNTFESYPAFQSLSGKMCTHFKLNLGDIKAPSQDQQPQPWAAARYFKCATEEVPIADVFKEPKSVFGIVGMYTYGILKLDKLNDITLSQVELVKSTPGLLVKVVFDGLFILVYLLLLAALFIALFVRGVRIWLYIMLSPAFGLMYFFHQSKGAGDMGEFGILEFIKLALVPIYVGTALSFGMLFLIIVGKQMQFSASDCSNSSSFMCCSKTVTDIPTCTITAWSLKFEIEGAVWAGLDLMGQVGWAGASALGDLIIKVFGLAVLWMAVMAALRSSSITQKAVEPIYNFGKTMGEVAMKSPQYLPILPGGLSAAGLPKISDAAKNVIHETETNATTKWLGENVPFLDVGKIKVNEAVKVDADKIAGRSDAANLDKLAEHLSSFKKTEDVRNSKELQEWLRQLGKQFGAEATEKWEFKTASDVADSLSKLNESIFQKTARTIFGKPGTITVREIDAALSKTPSPPDPKKLPLSDESPLVSPIARAPNGIQLTSSTLLEIGGDGLLTSHSLDLLAHRLERGMSDGTVTKERIKSWMLDKGDNGLGLSEANYNAAIKRLSEFMDKRIMSDWK